MNKEWPGYPAVICQNLICVGAGVLCAIYYDRIGDLIRYAGSLCAAIYMYLLPCLVKLIDEKKENGKISIISMIIHCIIILYGTANFILQFAVEAY